MDHVNRVADGEDFFFKLTQQEVDEIQGERFYKYMSDCISYERKRIGGDWAVAQAVPTRKLRDGIRTSLGNDKVVFFLLSLEREVALERLTQRDGAEMADSLMKINSFYEPKAPDENDTFDIIIPKEMTPKDVAQKIIEIVNKL